METTSNRGQYLAYLVRLWQVNGVERPTWRASIEDPHTGERRGFPDLESLFAFLKDQMGNSVQINQEGRA